MSDDWDISQGGTASFGKLFVAEDGSIGGKLVVSGDASVGGDFMVTGSASVEDTITG